MSLQDRMAVGIDVSKAKLDIFHGGLQQHKGFECSPTGIVKLIAWWVKKAPLT